jgi:hypothetical protein
MPAHRSIAPLLPKQATFQEWHKIMGHLNPKALSHLPKAAIGVEFTMNKLDLEVYEQCYLTNLK